MKQYRGCSKLFFAIGTEDPSTGAVTYGTPKELAPVKSVSRDITSEHEDVYADNTKQQTTYGATSVTRTFEVTRIDPAVVAEIYGDSAIAVGSGASAVTAYAMNPDGSNRPIIAVGYALHDGNRDQPCEVVWCYNCICNNITKNANTIDDGTGSEGQSVEIINHAPKLAFSTTGKRQLSLMLPITDANKAMADTWFAQVVTPDNIASVLG